MKRLTMHFIALAGLLMLAASPSGRVTAVLATEPVDKDADDPAIWINQSDPAKSLVLGACKGGGLYAFNLQGKTVQTVKNLQHLNNVDLEYGFSHQGKPVDIAVATERGARRLLIFTIDTATGHLTNATGTTAVFEGQEEEKGAPMGIALYKRPKDGAIFAFVSRKEGPKQGYIWQYRLIAEGGGKVGLLKVRELGTGTGDEIESLAVDDELGYLYCSEEKVGIHKYHADPDHKEANKRLALFGQQGFMADREGIGIYTQPGGKGYIVISDQGDGESEYHVYSRQGTPANPHDHKNLLAEFKGGADSTDGLEVVSTSLPGFAEGMLAVMNSKDRNFMLYRWSDIKALLGTTN